MRPEDWPEVERIYAASEEIGLWTLQASVFAVNLVSLRLHEQAGFRLVGTRERIAQRDGRWHDTVMLERRSPVVAIRLASSSFPAR